MLPRAIVRDLFDVHESRLLLTAIALVQGIAPVIAPSLGALILYIAPWRTIYLALAAIGVFLLAIGFSRFRELQPEGARQSLKPAAVVANYQRALTNRFCLGFSLILGLTFGGMFSYINTSPLLFMQGYGVTKAAFAGLFALTSMGVIAGASLNSALVRRHVKPKTALDLALSLTAIAALALLVVSLAGLELVRDRDRARLLLFRRHGDSSSPTRPTRPCTPCPISPAWRRRSCCPARCCSARSAARSSRRSIATPRRWGLPK